MAVSTRIFIAGTVLALASGACPAQSNAPAGRGQLLYENHCVACHDRQVHWRAAKLATDWATLVAQVHRWQAVARLQWTDEDVMQVARHLNDTVYRFPVARLTGKAAP